MAAIEFDEWIKGKRSYYVEKYGILLTEPEKNILREVWSAARNTMEESRTSTNKQSTPCSHTLRRSAIVCPICETVDYFTD